MSAKPLDSDVQANYVGAFDGSLSFGEHPVLLMVDVCKAYIDPDSPLYAGVESSAESMKRLVAVAREVGVPVVWTRGEYVPGGTNGGYFYKKVPALRMFDKGSPFGEWIEDLAPVAGELVVTKQYPSAFIGTDLANTLHGQGVDTVLITGWSTSGCVRATGVDTVSYGFIPIVIREAVGDRHPGPHEANLFDLQAKYAEVVSEEQALTYLKNRS